MRRNAVIGAIMDTLRAFLSLGFFLLQGLIGTLAIIIWIGRALSIW